jgi:hypothetical protein
MERDTFRTILAWMAAITLFLSVGGILAGFHWNSVHIARGEYDWSVGSEDAVDLLSIWGIISSGLTLSGLRLTKKGPLE